MTDDKAEKLADSYKDGLKLDFNDLEQVEFALVDLGQKMSMLDDACQRAQGRALKALAPAWVEFLRHEMDRNENNGPGQAIFGLTRVCALLIAVLVPSVCKPGAQTRSKLADGIMQLFGHDFEELANKGRTNVYAEDPSSETECPWHSGRTVPRISRGNKGSTGDRKVG